MIEGGELNLQNMNQGNQPLIDVSTIEVGETFPISIYLCSCIIFSQSTVLQIPDDGNDIPDNLMLWGLPQKSSLEDDRSQGNVFNFEIRHNLPAKKKTQDDHQGQHHGEGLHTLQEVDFLSSTNKKKRPHHSNHDSGHLETLEEKDFLAPDSFDNYQGRQEMRRNRLFGLHRHSELRPVATRVILTRDELEKKLEELQEDQEDREDDLEDQLDEIARKQREEERMIKKIFMSLMTPTEKRKVFGGDY